MDPQKEGTGKHVLLTGANGFVATHILADLLDVCSLPIIHSFYVPVSYQDHRALTGGSKQSGIIQ
jgi:hypothetical protein